MLAYAKTEGIDSLKFRYNNNIQYINIDEVIENWNVRAICVLFLDGSDALLQENGYTVEDAIRFAGQNCLFFYD